MRIRVAVVEEKLVPFVMEELDFDKPPPTSARAKFPVKVIVVAWQLGGDQNPKLRHHEINFGLNESRFTVKLIFCDQSGEGNV